MTFFFLSLTLLGLVWHCWNVTEWQRERTSPTPSWFAGTATQRCHFWVPQITAPSTGPAREIWTAPWEHRPDISTAFISFERQNEPYNYPAFLSTQHKPQWDPKVWVKAFIATYVLIGWQPPKVWRNPVTGDQGLYKTPQKIKTFTSMA